jgi:energy-coupling factor transporter ATP-binding protein EcfA2
MCDFEEAEGTQEHIETAFAGLATAPTTAASAPGSIHAAIPERILATPPGELLMSAASKGSGRKQKINMQEHFLAFGLELEYAKDPMGNLYVTIEEAGFPNIVSINSASFQGFARDRLYQSVGALLSPKDFKTVLDDIKYLVQKKPLQEKETINRVRRDGDHLYLDMCSTPPSFLKFDLSTGTEQYVSTTPFLPQRFPKQKKLPKPIYGDKAFEDFFALLNVNDVEDRALIQSILVARLVAHQIMVPHLMIMGDKGSGKTTLSRLVKNIIDPTNAPSHLPSKQSDLIQLLAHQYMPVIDNVSHISRDFSNTLCTAVTGIEHGKRKLYTDTEEYTLYLKTSAIITAISVPRLKDDLSSRIFFLRRPEITGGYLSESHIEQEFAKLHPRLLGELLQICQAVSRDDFNQHTISTERTVDFTGILSLVCQHVYNDADLAAKIVERNDHYRGIEALAGNTVVAAIILFMADKPSWKGTLSLLMADIQQSGYATPDLPNAANAFSRKLTEGEAILEESGITFRKFSTGAHGIPYIFTNANYVTSDSNA